MVVIWIVAGALTAYVAYGFLMPTGYRRVFPQGLPEDAESDGYLHPREVVDPDEEALAKRISTSFAEDSLRRPALAGRGDPMFHEPHWGHTGALLRGALTIDAIENLPEQFRVGLFARAASYPVVARSGIARDPDLGFSLHRLAIKLDYPDPVPNTYAADGHANELDLLLLAGAPGDNGDIHRFFARDGRQLDMATTLKPPSLATARTFANWRNLAILLGMLGTIRGWMKPMRRAPGNTVGWAGKPYFSLGPFALGDGAMKFALMPRQTHQVPPSDPMARDVAQTNTANMAAWLDAGENAEFTLAIQLATPECIPAPGPVDPPKAVMAAEYCDLQWDETVSPYIPVGRLSLAADDAINAPEHWAALQFNAWNTLPQMRPLGQMFRMRKHTHTAHSNVRVAHLYGGEPGSMVGKCPFSG